jgi:hypothetical protein
MVKFPYFLSSLIFVLKLRQEFQKQYLRIVLEKYVGITLLLLGSVIEQLTFSFASSVNISVKDKTPKRIF